MKDCFKTKDQIETTNCQSLFVRIKIVRVCLSESESKSKHCQSLFVRIGIEIETLSESESKSKHCQSRNRNRNIVRVGGAPRPAISDLSTPKWPNNPPGVSGI